MHCLLIQYTCRLETDAFFCVISVASDFAFIPFGAGARKCIGDQFAMLEATSCLAMTLQRYNFELDKDAQDVGMEMGATIHTAGGLPMKVTRR